MIVVMPMHVTILENDNLKKLLDHIHVYVREHPRAWDSLMFHSIQQLNAFNENVQLRLEMRHCSSWNEPHRIRLDQGELEYFIYSKAEELDVNNEPPPTMRFIYQAGALRDGAFESGSASKTLLKKHNFTKYQVERAD